MQTYEFRFMNRAAMERAFSTVMSCEFVVDCIVNAPVLRLRFRAPEGAPAQRLFERIHLDGEIVASKTTPPSSLWSPWWEAAEPGRNWL